MGRNNKFYYKDLRQQARDKLLTMQAFGESKKAAEKDGTADQKIFSYNTYKTYWKHIRYFISWIRANHPECTTLKAARRHANKWLQERENDPEMSAWTIQTESKALNKLFGIKPGDADYFDPPKRMRKNIKRSRTDAERDKNFSPTNNIELIKFCQGTGGRRAAIEKLRADDLWSRQDMEEELRIAGMGTGYITDDGDEKIIENIKEALEIFPDREWFIHYVKDKGGRSRFAPIVGRNQKKIVERMQNTLPGKKVWEYVSGNADVHSYRRDYATTIYKQYARNIEDIPYDGTYEGRGRRYQKDVYVCRKDEAGKKLDKKAMLKCSKALGHNRLNVVADHYLTAI